MGDQHELEAALVRVANESKALGYNPTSFLRMIHELGGLQTTKQLINSDTPSDGFVKLWEMKRLDLTVEALVVESKQFRTLFLTSEILRARHRLKGYGYEARS